LEDTVRTAAEAAERHVGELLGEDRLAELRRSLDDLLMLLASDGVGRASTPGNWPVDAPTRRELLATDLGKTDDAAGKARRQAPGRPTRAKRSRRAP
jgi:hypothetical protein